MTPSSSKPRLVVAGQVPPPLGGQNVMIARILQQARASGEFTVDHLAFRFTPQMRKVRRAGVGKLIELARVLARLARLRLAGPIDLLLFPAGGPQTVPIVRDILLLPFVRMAARRVVVQFHAAGIADRCHHSGGWLCKLLRTVYQTCDAAIVMTAFNRRDPEALGFRKIAILPYRLPDEFDASLVRRQPGEIRLLNLGHLCPDKGTPDLLRAFAAIAAKNPDVILELVGEAIPPWSPEILHQTIEELGLTGRVQITGILTGREKQAVFGRAHAFLFPTVAPYESFGLVMVEAMMWGLPVIATDWRGNRDVLGPAFEGLCHPVGQLEAALTEALAHLRAGTWSGANRELFLERYRYSEEGRDYVRQLRRWL